MRRSITVQIPDFSPPVLQVARALRSHSRLSVQIASRHVGDVEPRGDVLRIELGSRLEPIVTLLWGAQPAHEAERLRQNAVLGSSAAVFGRGSPGYEWSEGARPLPDRACFGRPDLGRPWVLVAPHARITPAAVSAMTGLADPQLHFLKPRSDVKGASVVWWLPTRAVLLSLLGRVHALVASQGPLAWDAARLGVPVVEPEPVTAMPARSVERRLASIVPASLVKDDTFWTSIGQQLADGVDDGNWGTIAWTRRARDSRSPRSVTSWRRKLWKLKRDPASFWADSQIVKRLSEVTNSALPAADDHRE